MSGSHAVSNHNPLSHGHHGHDHDDPEKGHSPRFSLLQASALLRLGVAIGLLLPLWIAVYLMVS